jgi:hypothetical protein
VRGTVANITSVFEERPGEGPRQVVALSGVTTLLGQPQPDAVNFRIFGGQLPDGDVISASHTPHYEVGGEYVAFLFNRAWRFAPVVLDYTFRVRSEQGKDVLIHQTGHVLTGALGGQVIQQSFAAAEQDPSQGLLQPLSEIQFNRTASTETYSTELVAIAQACPEGPSGVFSPYPVVPWDVLPAVAQAPVIGF